MSFTLVSSCIFVFFFQVNKRSSVIRFMFFNKQDIEHYKKAKLRTKHGRSGHIKVSLGITFVLSFSNLVVLAFVSVTHFNLPFFQDHTVIWSAFLIHNLRLMIPSNYPFTNALSPNGHTPPTYLDPIPFIHNN